VLLTGTPLQNNVDELFSLLSFLEPRQFSSSEAFMAEFGRLETESQVDKLKAVCYTYCLVYAEDAPCGLQGCENRLIAFSSQMSYKATKAGSVCLS